MIAALAFQTLVVEIAAFRRNWITFSIKKVEGVGASQADISFLIQTVINFLLDIQSW